MATIDFNLLRSEGPQNLYEGFLQGQKAGADEQERNMLRQSQMQQMEAQRENILAQREQRLAQASQQQSAEAGRRRRQEVLGRLSSSFEANGLTLDRKTLGEMYKAGLELGDNNLITTATTGLKALDDEERDKAEMARFGLGPSPAAPAAPAAAPAAPPPTNAFAVPSLAEGAAAPAPVNAMVDRNLVQQMIMNPRSPRVRQMGQALAGTLEKPEASPADVRAYEYARNQGYTGSFMDFKAAQRPPGTNVRVALPPQPKEEQEARGRLLVKGYETISDAARVAARSLPALETQERVLDSGFRTGFGAEAQTTAARVLSALGVENAKEYAKSSEAFSAAASQAVLQRQLEQKGVQTEADAQRISQTGAQLGNTPEGNKFIISVARAQFNRDIAQRNFYDSWWKKNGTYDGAEDAWFSGPGSKSLFESPELKRFAAPKPGKERPSLQSIFK